MDPLVDTSTPVSPLLPLLWSHARNAMFPAGPLYSASGTNRIDDAGLRTAAACLVGAIGPVTAEALRDVGLPADVVSERAGVKELVESLVARVRSDVGESG